MIGGLIRFLIVVVLVVAAAAFFLGYRVHEPARTGAPIGTAGRDAPIDRERARERGAELGEKSADAVNQAGRSMSATAITAKIEAKMALDNLVRARDMSIGAGDGVVTLGGAVHSPAERARALQLVRETDGVRSVIDHLELK